MDIFAACKTGNLEWLKQQTAAGTLPDLMMTDRNYRYPHEHAARNGHLDVVRWLVEDSGQLVDVTADDNAALRHATDNNYAAVADYLNFVTPLIQSVEIFNFQTVMRVFGGDLEAVKMPVSVVPFDLLLTEDDVRSLQRSIFSNRPLSARSL